MSVFRAFSKDTGPRAASTSGVKPVARLAWMIVAFNTAIILWGAYVRVSGSGGGCGSRWPLCNGEILSSGAQSQTLIEQGNERPFACDCVFARCLVSIAVLFEDGRARSLGVRWSICRVYGRRL